MLIGWVLKKTLLNLHHDINPRTLLLKMEKEEIGTKATRAATIQTLYDRKYLYGVDNLMVSDLGFEVTEILSKYCPAVVSPELTKELEARNGENSEWSRNQRSRVARSY